MAGISYLLTGMARVMVQILTLPRPSSRPVQLMVSLPQFVETHLHGVVTCVICPPVTSQATAAILASAPIADDVATGLVELPRPVVIRHPALDMIK